MAEATSITNRRIKQEGLFTLWEIKATASDAETITIPTTDPITTSSTVSVVCANNITDGTSPDGTLSVSYDDGNRRFTYDESGTSDEDVRILYYVED